VFALAPGHSFGFAQVNFQRSELGCFVGAIAKRLQLGLSASAPEMSSFHGLLHRREFLSNDWSLHEYTALKRMNSE
jgi:hypothetical protein